MASGEGMEGTALFGYRDWFVITTAAVISCLLFIGAGRMLGIPPQPSYQPSVFMQDGAVINLMLSGVLLCICVVIGTLIARSARQDAGFFAACAGLAALAARSGEVHYAYRAAESGAIFLLLAVETFTWYLLVAAAWCIQWWFYRTGFVRGDVHRDQMEDPDHPIGISILATLTHAAAMCMLMLLLARSDNKAQALAAVGVSAFLASLLAHSLFNVTPSVWLWISPLLVGVIGYLLAFGQAGAAEEWRIGLTAQPMARATPLDYASAGPLGAVLGYWLSRKWHANKQRENVEARRSLVAVPPPRQST